MPAAANLSRPAYLSLAEQFARAIESGEIASGTRLMPHRKLADQLGLSVQTVSRAYEELTRRGLVQGEIGRGSFVLGPGAEGEEEWELQSSRFRFWPRLDWLAVNWGGGE